MSKITISIDDQILDTEPGTAVTFGRSRDSHLCLDPDDEAVSRRAGSLEHDGEIWWVTNRSSARSLSLVDDLGFRTVLPPGRRAAIEVPTRVIVDGTRGRSYTLRIEVAEPRVHPDDPPPPGTPTAVGEEVLINDNDRLAMVALFAGYLEDPPRYDPNPRPYNAAAARLGWPRTTLVKRIEYLRTRLDRAGVPNMTGWNALTNLAEYALARGLITKDDLRLLRR